MPWALIFTVAALMKIANGVTNSAASLVPASVPRPVAKLAVVGIGSLVALWLFGKVRMIASIHCLQTSLGPRHVSQC